MQFTTLLKTLILLATQNKGYSLWLLSTTLGGFLALSPIPHGQAAGAAVASAATTGAIAHDQSKKRTSELERLLKLEQSRTSSESDKAREEMANIAAKQRELDKAESQLMAFQANLKTREDTYRDRAAIEAEKAAQATAQATIAKMQAELDKAIKDKESMQVEYQEKSEKAAKAIAHTTIKTEKWRKEFGDKAAQTISVSNEVLANERQQVNQVLENLGTNIKAIAAELAEHKELVAKLQAPKQFKFASFEADTANQIQMFLAARGAVMSCDSIGKIHYGSTPIYFEPINCDLEAVKKQLEPLQLALGLSELPTAQIEQGKIKMTVQLSQDKTPKPAKDLVIVDPPLSKLEQALNDSIHARIVAQSGSGKTVLLGNLINYLTQQVSSDYVLSDPKVTAPENWGNLKPRYYARECLTHFFELTETCMNRIDKAADSVRATGKIPDFETQFHVIDELEFLYGLSEVSSNKDHNSKLFKINAKSMLKVGREHKMKLLFVTQSPLCTDLNLRKNDFENCSSIFLGSQISAALNSTDDDGLLKDVSTEKIAQLKAEHRARMNRGDEFIYLFFNPAKPDQTFFGRCPSPGHYAALAGATVPTNDVSQSGDSEGVAPRTLQSVATGASQSQQGLEQGTGEGTAAGTGYSGTASAPPAVPTSTALESLLNQGTHCPDCGHHSSSYAKPTPNTKGNVSVKCKNKDCSRKTFSWKVL